jgi:hypothetical protein
MNLNQRVFRNSLLIAVATGISLSAAPAHAEDECLLNGPTDGGASAFGTGSLACGANASASTGSYQTTIGSESVVSGNATTALGYGAFATATGAIAIGGYDPGVDVQRTRADGADSIAIGHMAVASATGGIALGAGSIADQANTLSLGIAGSERRIVNLAAGTADTDAVNVGQLNAAVAGVTTDVTTVQATTATHTTQIANLQTGLATTDENVSANTTAIATNTTDIADLQTGLADTNAALGALDGRVDALEAITANLDERFDDVADRADAGTAVAVALSGAMFLPGKTFNLTGNVGAYRGAVAGAMQIGALVSESVALNAGVAHGFNKHGKTAVRAGFTFGW